MITATRVLRLANVRMTRASTTRSRVCVAHNVVHTRVKKDCSLPVQNTPLAHVRCTFVGDTLCWIQNA
jgi:hypothetical protein